MSIELSKKQMAAVPMLAAGMRPEDVAPHVGVSARTVHRWSKNELIQEKVKSAQVSTVELTDGQIVDIHDIYQREIPGAIQILVGIFKDKEESTRTRIAAINSFLDRGLGKPGQAVEHSGRIDSAVAVFNVNWVGDDGHSPPP